MSDDIFPSVYIVSGCRTPIGNFQGKLSSFTAMQMGAAVIQEALKRANIAGNEVDEVIMGQVLTAGQGQNPARQAAVSAKLPYSVPATTINMLCGSGLKAVMWGFEEVRCGNASIVVAGGQESMTRAHHSSYVRGAKLGTLSMNDTLMIDGLTDAFNDVVMGKTAEHLAVTHSVSREEQDAFALSSQSKAARAIANGYFDKEIIQLREVRTNIPITLDEYPKIGTTCDDLAKLRPAFVSNGSVTAGNSSGINDGAAALVLCNRDEVKKRELTPIVRIVGCAQSGIEPMCMGLGPIKAIQKLLEKINWPIDTVDLFELNEAFAVQSIIVARELHIDENRINVCGGAIALGHPIGASGARVLVTLIHNLQRLNQVRGVAALCVGGGMGVAIAVERSI